MPLIQPQSSEPVRRALVAGLPDFERIAGPLARDLYRADQGHAVFTLGLQDLSEGKEGLAAAQPAGWRFLAGTAMGPAVAAHVSPGPDGIPKLRGLSTGPEVAHSIRLVHEVADLAQVMAQPYEMRVLKIPGVLIEAFWLKSPSGGEDLIIPYLANAEGLNLMQGYPMDKLLSILKATAQEFLLFDKY